MEKFVFMDRLHSYIFLDGVGRGKKEERTEQNLDAFVIKTGFILCISIIYAA